MRNTIIGGLLAVVVIGLLFLAANLWPHPTPAQRVAKFEQIATQSANQIQKGFVGVRAVGRWQVVCLATPVIIGGQPKPAASAAKSHPVAPDASSDSDTAGAGDQAAAAPDHKDTKTAADNNQPPAKPISFGRCRASVEFAAKERPQQPFMGLSFRLVGDQKVLTAFVRFPPIAKRGEAVLLVLGRNGLKLPVIGCSQSGCLARAGLAAAAQTAILSTPGAILVLPQGPRGNRLKSEVPFIGLAPALTALRRAEG